MDILLQYLDPDTAGLVCEFLINGDDYSPFTLENIRQLEGRIYNWVHCMQWAARVGNIPILKYVGKKKKNNRDKLGTVCRRGRRPRKSRGI